MQHRHAATTVFPLSTLIFSFVWDEKSWRPRSRQLITSNTHVACDRQANSDRRRPHHSELLFQVVLFDVVVAGCGAVCRAIVANC